MPRLGVFLALLVPAGAAATTAVHIPSPLEGLGITVGGERQLGSYSSAFEHLGCFADNQKVRALEEVFMFEGSLKPKRCARKCTKKGYRYMGLQHGGECWCGSLGEEERHTQHGEGSCNIPCAGDDSEKCGGVWAFDLYSIDPCYRRCLNDGTCTTDSAGLYTCSCASGYAGPTCETDTSGYSEFSIAVVFKGTWTEERKDVFESAANRWAQVITHIPCTGTSPLGDDAGVLNITATLATMDGKGGVLGGAGPRGAWQDCRGISYAGGMTLDIDDVSTMEEGGYFEGVILHEMGHAIGVGTLWGDCRDCRYDGNVTTGSGEWMCPLGAEVYNNLAGNKTGSAADILEMGGALGTRCSHFDEKIFGNELMTGYANTVMPLSKLTAATLADREYAVDMSMTDDYILPSKRSTGNDMGETNTIEINDEVVGVDIDISDEHGVVVGTIEGRRFRF